MLAGFSVLVAFHGMERMSLAIFHCSWLKPADPPAFSYSNSCKTNSSQTFPANMPFKSKAQSRACFASGGFDGSVDCMKWAKSTQYKKLPARVKKPKKK